MIFYRPTANASDIYRSGATAHYVRDNGTSDPVSFADAAKNAIVVQSKTVAIPVMPNPPTTK